MCQDDKLILNSVKFNDEVGIMTNLRINWNFIFDLSSMFWLIS